MVRVHWLAVTIHLDLQSFLDVIWTGDLERLFGELIPKNHGGRGYQKIYTALNEVKVYTSPLQVGKNGVHVHLEIPGGACDAITPDKFTHLINWLTESGIVFRVTRLDLAWDDCGFTPLMVLEEIKSDRLTSLVKRQTITYTASPWELRDDGQVGTHTLYIGSRESQRMVRIYDKRGGTRLELQCRDERAHLVCQNVLGAVYGDWNTRALGHLRQYIEFDLGKCGWWVEFVSGSARYDIKISAPRVITLRGLQRWMLNQVSMAFYALNELSGTVWQETLHMQGEKLIRQKARAGGSRYDVLLGLCKGAAV